MSVHPMVTRPVANSMQDIRGGLPVHPPQSLLRCVLLCVLGVWATLAQSQASDSDWQNRSPVGADIVDLAWSPRDPDTVLAAHSDSLNPGQGGLFRSSDSGRSWQAVAALGNRAVNALAFSASGRAFIGTSQGLMTADAELNHWVSRDLGIGLNQNILALNISPATPQLIWAGLSAGNAQAAPTLMRSLDGGAHWQNHTPASAAAMSVRSIAVDAANPNRMAIACSGEWAGGALWTSEDAGLSWSLRSNGLPNQPMLSVAFVGARLFVGGGSRLGQQNFGLHASDDLGRHWYPLHRADWPSLVITDIASSLAGDDTLWIATDGAGVSRSDDGGRHWQHSLPGSASLSLRRIRVSRRGIAVAALGEGVLQSLDGESRLQSSAHGMHARVVRAVAIDPGNDQHLAISLESLNTGSVHQSFDGGLSWQQERLPPTRFNSLSFDAFGQLFAVSGGPSTVAPEGLYRRQRDGQWQALGPDQGPQYETDITTLRVGRRDTGLLLMAGADRGSAGSEGTIWISRDRGLHWLRTHESRLPGTVTDIEWIGDQDEVALASFDDASGGRAGTLLRTQDSGNSWVESSSGLPRVLSQPKLCVSESNPRRVYLVGNDAQWRGSLFRSDDAGRTWFAINNGTSIQDIACDPTQPDTIYTVRTSTTPGISSVQRSDDGGVSFVADNGGLLLAGKISSLTINLDASDGITLLAASRRGAYLKRTRGKP